MNQIKLVSNQKETREQLDKNQIEIRQKLDVISEDQTKFRAKLERPSIYQKKVTFPKIRQKLEKIRSISVYGNKLELLEPPSSLMSHEFMMQ